MNQTDYIYAVYYTNLKKNPKEGKTIINYWKSERAPNAIEIEHCDGTTVFFQLSKDGKRILNLFQIQENLPIGWLIDKEGRPGDICS